MNIETLRREYGKLTPFEREALLVRESVGRQRDTEIDALGARSLFEALWMCAWGHSFFTVAAWGLFRALWAERTAWMCLLHAEEAKGTEREEQMYSLADKCFRASVGWLRALKRLEEECGAPFMDSGKMLDPNYADKLLTQYEEEDIDDSEQYAALREIWDVECSNVNREDQGRKLPPLHPAGNAGHQENTEGIS